MCCFFSRILSKSRAHAPLGNEYENLARAQQKSLRGNDLLLCQASTDRLGATAGLSSSAETWSDKPTVALLISRLTEHYIITWQALPDT
jgi:hypothetical protein